MDMILTKRLNSLLDRFLFPNIKTHDSVSCEPRSRRATPWVYRAVSARDQNCVSFNSRHFGVPRTEIL